MSALYVRVAKAGEPRIVGDSPRPEEMRLPHLRSQSGEDIKIFSTVEDAHRLLGLE